MLKFDTLTSVAVPLPQANIDTDQIIPARFLCKPREEGLASYLFHDQRLLPDGSPNLAHVLNQSQYAGAAILVGGPNFGCGSSREHAICALLHSGIRVVIAPGISDIFIGNALENGLLPISLAPSEIATLFEQIRVTPEARVGVDLEAQHVILPDGSCLGFDIDQRRKRCLLLGLDSIELTLQDRGVITAFESQHEHWL